MEKLHIDSVFYLVRHAHADWTPDEGRPLSDRGQEDAARVAEILAEYPLSQIYSSPYKRARQTIEPLASRLGFPVFKVFDLRERHLREDPVDNFDSAVAATWRDFAFSHPGGESNAQAQLRGVKVIQKLDRQHPREQIVLSTHGNLLALILNHFDLSCDFAFWKSLTMPDIYRLSFDRSGEIMITRLW